MFVDQAAISIKAGNGGKGCISFRREKFVPKGGPDGGNGGDGGDVIIVANQNLHTLLDLRYRNHYRAKDGEAGSSSRRNGKSANDLIIPVPCGTVVKDFKTKEILCDLTRPRQHFNVVHGGKGGRGNSEFASATHQTPRYAEPGEPGEEKKIIIELKLIADVGLVGLPNAGKSTLISTISSARPKIADYPFTTLEPVLGIVRYKEHDSFTLADIPGIIEGASAGKGLGLKFLRHIERTKVLVYVIDCTVQDYEKVFQILENELKKFRLDIAKKSYCILMTKYDLKDEDIDRRISLFKKKKRRKIAVISAATRFGVNMFLDTIWHLLKE